jgi:hypothetical protein
MVKIQFLVMSMERKRKKRYLKRSGFKKRYEFRKVWIGEGANSKECFYAFCNRNQVIIDVDLLDSKNWRSWHQQRFTFLNPFIFHMPPLTHLPASGRSCYRRSTNGITDWRKRTQSWQQRSYSVNRHCQCICTGDHDALENFYTRLGVHIGTLPLPSPFGNIKSSLIQPTCHSKGKSTS